MCLAGSLGCEDEVARTNSLLKAPAGSLGCKGEVARTNSLLKAPAGSTRGPLTARFALAVPFGHRASRWSARGAPAPARRSSKPWPLSGRPRARCAPRSLRSLWCLHRPPSSTQRPLSAHPNKATHLPSRFAHSLRSFAHPSHDAVAAKSPRQRAPR